MCSGLLHLPTYSERGHRTVHIAAKNLGALLGSFTEFVAASPCLRTQFMMLCFAEDNWDIRTQAAYDSGPASTT